MRSCARRAWLALIPSLLMAVADKELSFATEAKAQTSSAEGLFQFIESTWLGVVYEFGAKYGLEKELARITRSGRQFIVADAAERERILQLRREPYSLGAPRRRDAEARYIAVGEGARAPSHRRWSTLIHLPGSGRRSDLHRQDQRPAGLCCGRAAAQGRAGQPADFYADAGGQSRTLTVAEVQRKFEEMIRVRLDRYRVVKTSATATK